MRCYKSAAAALADDILGIEALAQVNPDDPKPRLCADLLQERRARTSGPNGAIVA